jgi:hypothetical protein
MTTIPAPTCHHLFPDHHRCGSPALRNEPFCYFHHPQRTPTRAPRRIYRALPSPSSSLNAPLTAFL